LLNWSWRLGRDALTDDASLDDDGALRALFAGNHSGGCAGARGKPVGLLHFGENRLDFHAHQRGGDLRLLLMIFRDARGIENRLFQCGRIAPHAPCAVLGLPVFAHRGLANRLVISRDPYVALQYETDVAMLPCAEASALRAEASDS